MYGIFPNDDFADEASLHRYQQGECDCDVDGTASNGANATSTPPLGTSVMAQLLEDEEELQEADTIDQVCFDSI